MHLLEGLFIMGSRGKATACGLLERHDAATTMAMPDTGTRHVILILVKTYDFMAILMLLVKEAYRLTLLSLCSTELNHRIHILVLHVWWQYLLAELNAFDEVIVVVHHVHHKVAACRRRHWMDLGYASAMMRRVLWCRVPAGFGFFLPGSGFGFIALSLLWIIVVKGLLVIDSPTQNRQHNGFDRRIHHHVPEHILNSVIQCLKTLPCGGGICALISIHEGATRFLAGHP